MKKSIFILLLFVSTVTVAQKKILITCSETDAVIKVDGSAVGNGNYTLSIPWAKKCSEISVEKTGFITYKHTFCIADNPPKAFNCLLEKDESYFSSSSTSQANVDVSVIVKKGLNEDDAWKLISQMITDNFDVIELTDKATGYMRTSWVTQSFNYHTVRTRVIVKRSNENPLSFKIKLVSEFSNSANTPTNQDQLFQPWDRVLRKYENIIPDFQLRLAGTN